MSGFVRSIRVRVLYRSPVFHKARRRRISGAVSRVRTERMISLRFSLVNWSTDERAGPEKVGRRSVVYKSVNSWFVFTGFEVRLPV